MSNSQKKLPSFEALMESLKRIIDETDTSRPQFFQCQHEINMHKMMAVLAALAQRHGGGVFISNEELQAVTDSTFELIFTDKGAAIAVHPQQHSRH